MSRRMVSRWSREDHVSRLPERMGKQEQRLDQLQRCPRWILHVAREAVQVRAWFYMPRCRQSSRAMSNRNVHQQHWICVVHSVLTRNICKFTRKFEMRGLSRWIVSKRTKESTLRESQRWSSRCGWRECINSSTSWI